MTRAKVFRMGNDPGPQETGIKYATIIEYYDTKRVEYNPQEPATHSIKTKEERGREAWGKLHGEISLDPSPEAVARWEPMIPCGDCKKGYLELIEIYPFDFSSPDAFFQSTVRLHNAVNEKLIAAGDTAKRIVSLDEAREIWNRPAH